jgi:hypothetical protein
VEAVALDAAHEHGAGGDDREPRDELERTFAHVDVRSVEQRGDLLARFVADLLTEVGERGELHLDIGVRERGFDGCAGLRRTESTEDLDDDLAELGARAPEQGAEQRLLAGRPPSEVGHEHVAQTLRERRVEALAREREDGVAREQLERATQARDHPLRCAGLSAVGAPTAVLAREVGEQRAQRLDREHHLRGVELGLLRRFGAELRAEGRGHRLVDLEDLVGGVQRNLVARPLRHGLVHQLRVAARACVEVGGHEGIDVGLEPALRRDHELRTERRAGHRVERERRGGLARLEQRLLEVELEGLCLEVLLVEVLVDLGELERPIGELVPVLELLALEVVSFREGVDREVGDVIEAAIPERRHRVVFVAEEPRGIPEEDREEVAQLLFGEALLELHLAHPVGEELVRDAIEGDAIGRPDRVLLEDEGVAHDLPAHRVRIRRERGDHLREGLRERAGRLRVCEAVLAHPGHREAELLEDRRESRGGLAGLGLAELAALFDRIVALDDDAGGALACRLELAGARSREQLEQLGAHLLGRLEALRLLVGEGAVDQSDDLRRQVGRLARDRRRRLGGGDDELFGLGFGRVQALPGDAGVEAGADGEEVGATVDLVHAERLLGSDERRGAERDASACGLDVGLRLAHARDAEVEHLHGTLLGEEDVRRFDVAVDDLELVALAEQLQHRVEHREQLLERDTSAASTQELAERHALEQLHHQVGLTLAADPIVDDRHASRMLDAVRDAALAEEALLDVERTGELGVQDLDRGTCAVVLVGTSEHRAHAAHAEHAIDLPAVGEIRPHAETRLLQGT